MSLFNSVDRWTLSADSLPMSSKAGQIISMRCLPAVIAPLLPPMNGGLAVPSPRPPRGLRKRRMRLVASCHVARRGLVQPPPLPSALPEDSGEAWGGVLALFPEHRCDMPRAPGAFEASEALLLLESSVCCA
mmetsp:Transcript_28700/g.57834  ORF Transcript_28700/g.57834 Transcript_28700/m.57834 type:complete len:132 (-) Transcript_28700:215-610(-)